MTAQERLDTYVRAINTTVLRLKQESSVVVFGQFVHTRSKYSEDTNCYPIMFSCAARIIPGGYSCCYSPLLPNFSINPRVLAFKVPLFFSMFFKIKFEPILVSTFRNIYGYMWNFMAHLLMNNLIGLIFYLKRFRHVRNFKQISLTGTFVPKISC